MDRTCIENQKLEDTGFSYTMSLIQGKYKLIILTRCASTALSVSMNCSATSAGLPIKPSVRR